MFAYHSYDSGADYYSVRDCGHLLCLFRRGYAEAYCAWDIRVSAYSVSDRCYIRLYLAANTCDSETRHDVQKSFGAAGDLFDTRIRCRRDERYQINAVLSACRRKFLLFLEGNVRENYPVYPDLGAGLCEPLRAVGENHIRVCHEYQRDMNIFAQISYKVKDLVGGDIPRQSADICRLYHRTFRRRIRERYSEFYKVRPVLHHFPHYPACRFEIRISAGHKRDKSLSVSECFLYITHRYSPLCNAR